MTRLLLQHFSSDLTLIGLAVHRPSRTAKVFELAPRLLSLWHYLPRIFAPFLSRSALARFQD